MKRTLLSLFAAVVLLIVLEKLVNGDKRGMCSNLAEHYLTLSYKSVDPIEQERYFRLEDKFDPYRWMIVIPSLSEM